MVLNVRGAWPGPVVIRGLWGRARARPLNDDCPDGALRLDRGGAAFLGRSTAWLLERGVPAVISPPLPPTATAIWHLAGFRFAARLVLMERDLRVPIGAPAFPVRPGEEGDWAIAAEIDRAAFAPEWRLGRLGLGEAAEVAARSVLLVAGPGDRPAGFAIAGVSMTAGYLQRIAVDPAAQGRGIGRALVREAMRWSRAHGASSMLLNTQVDNAGATSLYGSESFTEVPPGLALLRKAR